MKSAFAKACNCHGNPLTLGVGKGRCLTFSCRVIAFIIV